MRWARAGAALLPGVLVLAGLPAPTGGGLPEAAAATTTTYLSSLSWSPATNGFGPVERDTSNGAQLAGDGRRITLNGVGYDRGLGTHANATIVYAIPAGTTTFESDVGVDDECSAAGTVVFRVRLGSSSTDAFNSGVMNWSTATKKITLDVTGSTQLRLFVDDGGNGTGCDHADWADARFLSGTTTSTTTSSPSSEAWLSTLTPTQATNGLGPFERDRHNGGSAAGDGGPLVVAGTTYARGVGVYPRSMLIYELGRRYTRFKAVFGIDDSCGNNGRVRIEVHRVIGTQDYAVAVSPTLTGASAARTVDVDMTNADRMILWVIDDGSNGACARSDWADARLVSPTSVTTTSPPTTSSTTTSTTSTTTTTTPPGGTNTVRFDDVTNAAGLSATATAYVHAAAWGEVNGDGKPDLFVGTFTHESRPDGQPPAPSRLFLSTPTGFQPSGQAVLEVSGTASGAVLADLDNDGDADLVVSNYRLDYGSPPPAQLLEPHRLYRNDGGNFVDVSEASGIRVSAWNGRSVGLLDYDGDGLLDLYLVADSILGQHTRVSRLFRNTGGLVFQDRTAAAGLPTNHSGLGVAVGDANGDTWPDLVTTGGVTESGAYARTFLYINNRNGTFRDATTANLAWTPRTNDDWTAGAAWGDLNGDDRLDLVVGHHYGSAAGNPIAPRVYLNAGNNASGNPVLEELTGAGITPIPARAPHVEIQDFDNDGRPDIYTSVRVNAPSGLYVYRNNGTVSGRPTFTGPPAPEIPYYSPGGPTADYDGDGRLDVFLEGLNRSIRPTLLRNTTLGTGNWLDVRVRLAMNTSGIGSRVRIYRAGASGQPGALLGTAEIATGNGFSSAQFPVAHFGLGANTAVDVEVVPPFGGPVLRRSGVAANRTLVVTP